MEKKHKKDNRRMKLQPGISTHFQWMMENTKTLTKNRVYTIMEWKGDDAFCFLDDKGDLRRWDTTAQGIECNTFKTNLDKVLD